MSKVLRNIVYNGLGQGLGLLVGFVAVRYVFRRLGGDALGLIYFSLAFSTALTVAVQLGICESAVREVASHHGNRPEYIKSFIRTSSTLYWVAYLVLAIVAYTASPYLVHHWVKLNSLDPVTAITIMRILSLGALVSLPGGLYRAMLTGLQHMGLTNVIDVSAKALQQAGIFGILSLHGNLFHVSYWIVASMVVQVAVTWVACSRYFSLRSLLVPGLSLAVVKENMGFASGLIAITLCSWVLGQVDRVIISKLLPLALLGIYTFARSAISQGQLLTSAINTAIFPHFSALHGSGKKEELKKAYTRIHDLICLGTVPIFAAVPFAAIPVFSRMFDMPSARLLLLPATFLTIGTYINGTLTSPYVVLLAKGRTDIAAKQNIGALFVVVPVSIVSIYFFGLNGAGFSWVVYGLFAYAYGVPMACRECLGMPARAWYWHVGRIMGLALLIYGGAWVGIASHRSFYVPYLVAAYVAGTIVYCAVSFRIMDPAMRESIMSFVQLWRLKSREVMVAD